LLELECEKLKKNLKHYKEEDKFNKSYLTKLKSSKTVLNQNDSIISLQEDNEALAQTIEDLQNEVGLKEENYTKLQKDLEDLLSHYEKNQARLNNIEKKSRENEKEVRVLREEKEELINKINLL
jgi:chromosome segregation ATPase